MTEIEELYKSCPRCNNWMKHDVCPVCKKAFNNLINESLLDDWRKMMCEKLADQNRDCPDNQNGNCGDCRYGKNYFTDEKIEYYKLHGKLRANKLMSSNNEETMVITKSKCGNWIGLLE